jgi:hypothetical protein
VVRIYFFCIKVMLMAVMHVCVHVHAGRCGC